MGSGALVGVADVPVAARVKGPQIAQAPDRAGPREVTRRDVVLGPLPGIGAPVPDTMRAAVPAHGPSAATVDGDGADVGGP